MKYIHGNKDLGDTFDSFKWDFDESNLLPIYVDDYLYKINDRGSDIKNYRIASGYHGLRKRVDSLVQKVKNYKKTEEYKNLDEEFKNGIDIFIEIYTSPHRRYYLSEIPMNNKKALVFLGLNKPKERYYADAPKVGQDANLRATYRDIFMNPYISGAEFENTFVHELSHYCDTTWKKDNHGPLFKRCEKFLKNFWV